MARKVLRNDWATAKKGDFHLENNVWNKGDLINGEDYSQTLAYNPANLSTNLKLAWNWPEADHILAYPEIVAGYKPWSGSGSDELSARISSLRTFRLDLDYDISGQTGLFNSAIDMWLTRRAHAGADSITTEVKILTHVGDIDDPAGHKVGVYRDGDFRAEIWVANNYSNSGGERSWRYITLVSKDEIRDDTLDIGRILDKLSDEGLVNERHFFNGYEFGAEVAGGKGSMMIHHIDHDFGTATPSVEGFVLPQAAADGFQY